jgi:hypothetical protein
MNWTPTVRCKLNNISRSHRSYYLATRQGGSYDMQPLNRRNLRVPVVLIDTLSNLFRKRFAACARCGHSTIAPHGVTVER